MLLLAVRQITWKLFSAKPIGGIILLRRVSTKNFIRQLIVSTSWRLLKFDFFYIYIDFPLLLAFVFSVFYVAIASSGGFVSRLGSSIVYRGTKSPIGIQRKPLYFDGNLQRISSYLLPERFNVSYLSMPP